MLKIRRILVWLTKIFITFIFIVFLSIFSLQKSYLFRLFCEQKILAQLGHALNGNVSFKLKSINLLKGELLFTDLKLVKENVAITFSDGGCHISWFRALKHLYDQNKIIINTSLINGSIDLLGRNIIKNCSAYFKFDVYFNKAMHIEEIKNYDVNCSFNLVNQNKVIEHCFLFGVLVGDKGHFKLKSDNDLIGLDIFKNLSSLKITSFCNVKFVNNFLNLDRKCKGKASVNCLIDLDSWLYEVTGRVNHLGIQHLFGNEIIFDDIRFYANNKNNNEHRLLVKDFIAKKDLIDCRYKEQNISCLLKADALIKKICSINGPCDLQYQGKLKDNKLTGRLKSTNMALVFPKIHNVLNGLDVVFQHNFNNDSSFIKNLLLKWHKGTITSQNQLIKISGEKSLIIPMTLSKFFFSPVNSSGEQQFFVYLNGPLKLTYNKDSSANALSLSGNLNIDKGGVLYNLSLGNKNPQGSKHAFDVDLNLVINAKNIYMKHKFFDLNFVSHLNVNGTMHNQQISGMVTIADGVFKFPSKNLVITQARIYVSDEIINLDINAKCCLNKYTITMRILGPISDPKIIFESEPLLSTEQIISLLVTGSHNTALRCLIPNLFIQNFASFVFGSQGHSSKKENYEPSEYVKQMLTLLKNIKISAADENQGSGKYVIELDLAEGLRFTINKDLNLEQPKQIGLEYDLSNGMTIKGTRDKNNNVGGELEFKWKL